MRKTFLALGQSDDALDAAYEARERDELPDDAPMTDDELDAMYRHFHQQEQPQ